MDNYKKNDLLKRIKRFGSTEAVDKFFELLRLMTEHLGLKEYDNRLLLYVRNNSRKRFTVNLGDLVLALSEEKGYLVMQFRVSREVFADLEKKYLMANAFPDSKDKATLVAELTYADYVEREIPTELIDNWLLTCSNVLPKNVPAEQSENHIPLMWEMLNDPMIYRTIMNEAMNYQPLPAMKFSEVIELVKQRLGENASLPKFRFQETHDVGLKHIRNDSSHVWISDEQDIIGNLDAHYEINIRRSKQKVEKYFVDIHFEAPKLNQSRFYTEIGKRLPQGLEWFDWNGGTKSIGTKVGHDIDDENLVERLIGDLNYLESSMGDRIRKIVRPEYKPTKSETMKPPLNRILYGPPGTGKTYNMINYAVSIIERKEIEEIEAESVQNREDVKERFDALMIKDWDVPKGRIGFITFHQSLSYEDFIEGIKPIPPTEESGSIGYDIIPGIFKKMVHAATQRGDNFAAIIEALKSETYEGTGSILTIKATGTVFDLKYKGGNVFYVHPHNSNKADSWYPVNIANIEQYFEHEVFISRYNDTYVREIVNYLKKEKGLRKSQVKQETKGEEGEDVERYVLIIDEINRGNVSQIFGELITLLEDGKRMGQSEELSVTLPYSKETFSVPDNLYIIGTMNTADRSVEALDAALRRRFSFVEKSPMPGLLGMVEGVDLVKMLTVINERLELLIDRDHTIGHAWFLGCKSIKEVASKFEQSIIPLLREYFYNDYGKIGLVLGDAFVRVQKSVENVRLAKFAGVDGETLRELHERPIYVIGIPEGNKEQFEAFTSIYQSAG